MKLMDNNDLNINHVGFEILNKGEKKKSMLQSDNPLGKGELPELVR